MLRLGRTVAPPLPKKECPAFEEWRGLSGTLERVSGHQPQIDQIAGTLMMVRSPRVWSCSRLAVTSSTQASTASRLGNS